MKDYTINLYYSEDDEAWVADIPDLFSCTATGDTPEEALSEVLVAKNLWLKTAREDGDIIPEPTYNPATEASLRRQKSKEITQEYIANLA